MRDAVNKISTYGVAVISNPTVCDVCDFHAAVVGEMKLFAVLGFLVCFLKAKFGLNLACKLRQSLLIYTKHVPLRLII